MQVNIAYMKINKELPIRFLQRRIGTFCGLPPFRSHVQIIGAANNSGKKVGLNTQETLIIKIGKQNISCKPPVLLVRECEGIQLEIYILDCNMTRKL